MEPKAMPVLFFTHGAPFLLSNQAQGAQWRAWGEEVGVPKAALVFSAHWETEDLTHGEVGVHQDLIYDFYGFDPAFYELAYPAPGAPDLVLSLEKCLGQPLKSANSRGLDHGVWVPLYHFWPGAQIPILQVSMPQNWSNQRLFDLGQAMRPLTQAGVVIIASGAVTHNLRQINWSGDSPPEAWAKDFDQWSVQALCQPDLDALLNWEQNAPSPTLSHPTPDHFRPLLVAAGAGWERPLRFPITGFELGNFSRRCIQWG